MSLRWRPVGLLLCSLVALSACKKSPPPEETRADAGPAGVTAPLTMDAGVSPEAPRRRDVADSASTLSLLQPTDGGACTWMRADPVAKLQSEVATLPEPCLGARIAWSSTPDAGVALIWFDPTGGGGSSLEGAAYPEEASDAGVPSGRLFLTEMSTGKVSPLPPPPTDAGALSEVGLIETAPTVLLLQPLQLPKGKNSVKVGGTEYSFDPTAEGLPALAHAFQFRDGVWTRVETKATDEGSDNAQGVAALTAAGELGPRTGALLTPRVQGDGEEEEETLKALASHKPPKGEGGWIFTGTSEGRLYIWEENMEFPFTMGRVVLPLALGDGGTQYQPLPELGFTPADFIAVRTQGPFILVSEGDSGRHPRLYDARTGALVWKSDSARAATFWPGAYVEKREHAD